MTVCDQCSMLFVLTPCLTCSDFTIDLLYTVELQEGELQYGEGQYAALATDIKFAALSAYYELPYICQYEGMLLLILLHFKQKLIYLTTSALGFTYLFDIY